MTGVCPKHIVPLPCLDCENLEKPSQFSDTPDEECPLCTECETTAAMERLHGTPEFVHRRADMGNWTKFGQYLSLKERTDLADQYERVWNVRRAREQAAHQAGTPLQGERSTDFHPDWTKYPKLSAALARHLEEEMVALLRDARADGVKFIRDVNAEELQKAFERGRTFFTPGTQTRSPVQGETPGGDESLISVRDAIRAGEVHLHYKGGRYRPLLIAKNSDDHAEERVIYVSLTHGSVWDRALVEWAETTIHWPDGIIRRRFVPQSFVSSNELVRLEVYWAERTLRAAEVAKIEAAKAVEDTLEVERDAYGAILRPSAALLAEAGFWKRMLIRKYCGCLSIDCGKHGAYDPADVDRVFALEEIVSIQRDRKPQ